jgi:anti-sigma28 factor (negative regulator of flagellin synthesis)
LEPENMSIRTSFGGLGSIFGVGETAAVSTPARSSAPASANAMGEDLATLSGMGSAMAMSGTGVRPGKVAGIQAAMARGGYSVPASAVAGKIVDFMLGTTA